MASIEESRAVVAGLTQELMEKNLLLEKFERALQSVEFSIGEYADKRLPRYFISLISSHNERFHLNVIWPSASQLLNLSIC
jgi:hypothetical protein